MKASEPSHDHPQLWAAYLAFYREQIIEAVTALTPTEQRRAVLPSGWTPLELLNHVLHMEQRWFVWGFLADPVPEPWGDFTVPEPWTADDSDELRPGARWSVAERVSADDLAGRLRSVGARTDQVLADHAPTERAAPGGRFADDRPTLEWVCFHVLQEYARHVGHLDVVVELLIHGDPS